MKYVIYLILPLILGLVTLNSNTVYAQNGIYDLNLLMHDINCSEMKVSVDLGIKAAEASSEFAVAEQNYRLSFLRDAVANPYIIQELYLSGVIPVSDGNYAIYSPHHLSGSIDTIISYNIESQSDFCANIGYENLTPVGRIGFDIVDKKKCLEIKWHTKSPEFFPNTSISERYEDELFSMPEGVYQNLELCFYDFCEVLPSAADDYASIIPDNTLTINVLDNDLDLNGNLNPNSFALVTMPPSSQLTVTQTATPGELVLTPATGFLGTVETFEYKICDTENGCVTAEISVDVQELTNTITPDSPYQVQLFPTLAQDVISVRYQNLPNVGVTNIQIVDLQGRVMDSFEKAISGDITHEFAVNRLAAGVYFLNTSVNGKWHSMKFVKL